MNKGFIYILVNPVMTGIVKIGKSKRNSEERAKEISRTTGVPINFEVVADFQVEDCDLMETIIHKALNQYRVNKKKEFFRLELKVAIKKVEEIIRQEEIHSMNIWWNELSVDWKKTFKLEIADFIYEEEAIFKLDNHSIDKINPNMLERILNMVEFGKFQYEESIQCIKPLSKLKKLQKLNLFRTSIRSLSPIKELYSLSKLDCSTTQVETLNPLRDLYQLSELELSGTNISSLEPLIKLSQLRILSISCTKVSDLSPLKNMNKLEEIYLSQTNVNNLAPLLSLPNLSLVVAIDCILDHSHIIDFKSKRKDCEIIVTNEEWKKKITCA